MRISSSDTWTVSPTEWISSNEDALRFIPITAPLLRLGTDSTPKRIRARRTCAPAVFTLRPKVAAISPLVLPSF